MRLEIRHLTTYHYSAPVKLGPQILRLTPRLDRSQQLYHYYRQIDPQPVLLTDYFDAAGNAVSCAWFEAETESLQISIEFSLDNWHQNPFDYLPHAWFTHLPVVYPEAEEPLLATYRHPGALQLEVMQLATELADQVDHEPLAFLSRLNDFLYQQIERQIREQGLPQAPDVTLSCRSGACRDLTVLFMAVCRAQGFASRFVSGYQAQAETSHPRRYLHAWPEVYIPGGGWRGYDPTHNLAVADGHVALAAARLPEAAAPIEGSFWGHEVQSKMDSEIQINAY
jgi:transglutaminase-like putative cysteine protease